MFFPTCYFIVPLFIKKLTFFIFQTTPRTPWPSLLHTLPCPLLSSPSLFPSSLLHHKSPPFYLFSYSSSSFSLILNPFSSSSLLSPFLFFLHIKLDDPNHLEQFIARLKIEAWEKFGRNVTLQLGVASDLQKVLSSKEKIPEFLEEIRSLENNRCAWPWLCLVEKKMANEIFGFEHHRAENVLVRHASRFSWQHSVGVKVQTRLFPLRANFEVGWNCTKIAKWNWKK